MRLLRVGPERRRQVAVAVGAAGLAAFSVIALSGQLEWALVLLAAGGYVVLVVAGVLYLRLRRQLLDAVAPLRPPDSAQQLAVADLERALATEIGPMGEKLEALRSSLQAQLAAIERSQAQLRTLALWRRASHRPGSQPGSREREIALIRASELFDVVWYQTTGGWRVADPVAHYVDTGARRGADPHPLFASTWYLEQHPDALESWLTPLGHFLGEGGAQLCDPHPAFWSGWYRERYLTGSEEILPVLHFLRHGVAEGTDPNPLFRSDWYRIRYGHLMGAERNPLIHYLTQGVRSNLDPSPQFRTEEVRRRIGTHSGDPLTAFLAARHDQPPPIANADEVDQRWEYLVRGLYEEPDTFVLYRIVGNDLPPRHTAGQTVQNLQFILDHEPELPGCEKRWVVNRIIDPRIEKQILAILEENGKPFIHIPFDPGEYRKVGWRFSQFDISGFTYRPEFDRLGAKQRLRALDHVYHDKNLYVMNNNGARNAALHQGRGLAKWVLPWDGNCFLTGPAWERLVAAVETRPHLKYFTVPMARILDNSELLRPTPEVSPTEEPQLVFRRDAWEQFNPNARYGRCPKVELLWRLGVPGPWHQWCRGPWDIVPTERSPEAGQIGEAGWVARLASGQPEQEVDAGSRWHRRIEAIWDCIDGVDERLARDTFDATSPFAMDLGVLERQRTAWSAGVPGPERVVRQLIELAESALRRPVAASLQSMIEEAFHLALAGFFTGDSRFLTSGADLVRTWFLRPGTGLTPHADLIPAHPANNFHYLLDAFRLLEREGALHPADTSQLRVWFDEFRSCLRDSEPGKAARVSRDHAGTWYDVQAAAVSAYLDDVRDVLATLRRSHERIGQQFAADGRQPEELRSSQPWHAMLFNLQGWVLLAGSAGRLGQDLWSLDADRLGSGVRWLVEYLSNGAEETADVEQSRVRVLTHLAARHLPATASSADAWQIEQVFPRQAGIRPFWILGSEAGDIG